MSFDFDIIHPKPRATTQTSKGTAVLAALWPPFTRPNCEGDDRYILDKLSGDDIRDMRGNCNECPLQAHCIEWGIAHEIAGFYGGLTPHEREVARKIRGQVLVEPHTGSQLGDDFMAPVQVEIQHDARVRGNATRRVQDDDSFLSEDGIVEYDSDLVHPLDRSLDATG